MTIENTKKEATLKCIILLGLIATASEEIRRRLLQNIVQRTQEILGIFLGNLDHIGVKGVASVRDVHVLGGQFEELSEVGQGTQALLLVLWNVTDTRCCTEGRNAHDQIRRILSLREQYQRQQTGSRPATIFLRLITLKATHGKSEGVRLTDMMPCIP